MSWYTQLYTTKGEVVWVFEIVPKRESSEFSYIKEGVGKISLSKDVFFSVFCVCVLLIYTISTITLCVWQEGLSVVECNQQMYDFCKWVIFEKQRHCEHL